MITERPVATHRIVMNTIGKAALILIITLFAYLPAMSAGFVWDDPQLLTQNPQIRDPTGIWKLWVAPTTADYFPLTSSVFWIEFRLGNVSPMWDVDSLMRHTVDGATNGYHLVNILLHGIAAVLTWRVLLALRIPGAWLTAVIFAVHPVGVESVAWISELKNTLAQTLTLLTVWAYFRFEATERISTYTCAVLLFCLSLTAKTSVVALPAVLLLCVWWQRGAITRNDVVRSLPFFAAAFILGLVTVYFQFTRAIGAEIIPIGGTASRVANAGTAVWFYISKLLWPLHLMPIYPPWSVAVPVWFDLLPTAALLGIFLACWRARARPCARAVLLALGSYTILLLPVIGLVRMSYMRLTLVADHFQYLPMVSIIALAVAAGKHWLPRVTWNLLAIVVVAVLCALTWKHAAIYHNEETLWTAALQENPYTWQGHNHLGIALSKKGDPAAVAVGFEHFQRAVELNPDNPEPRNNLALAYATRGQTDLAIEEYKRAIALEDIATIRTNLAIALTALERYAEAEEQYRIALHMEPSNPSRYFNLGYVLFRQGRIDEAVEQYRKALQLDPNMAEAQRALDAISNHPLPQLRQDSPSAPPGPCR